jgi:hypothetical protein
MAREMKLISLTEYQRLKDIEDKNINSRKGQVSKELLDDKFIADDIKIAMYSALLNNVNSDARQSINSLSKNVSTTVEEKRVLDEEKVENLMSPNDWQMLEALPKSFKGNGAILMRWIKKYPNELNWNQKGQVYFDGILAKDSNVIELLSYVLRPKLHWRRAPWGANRFIWTLKKINVPITLLGSHMRREFSRVTTDVLRKRVTPFSSPGEATTSFTQRVVEPRPPFRPGTPDVPEESDNDHVSTPQEFDDDDDSPPEDNRPAASWELLNSKWINSARRYFK